jgi:hypothetical protein
MDVPQIKIAVNVMRAGLTVIGFNIAVVSFQLERLQTLPGGFNVSGLKYSIHVGSHVSLLLAIPVSMVAIVGYIFSSRYDEIGICRSCSIVAADILMFRCQQYRRRDVRPVGNRTGATFTLLV